MNLSKNDLNKEPSGREKLLFGIVVFAILFLFVDFLWSPKSQEIRALKGNRANLEGQLEMSRTLIDAMKVQLDKKTEEPVKKTTHTDPYVQKVVGRNIVDITEEINSTADLMGSRRFARKAEVIKVDVGSRVPEGQFSVVPITVDLKGRYAAIRDYLNGLENIERPLVVKRISLKGQKEKGAMIDAKIETELFLPKM